MNATPMNINPANAAPAQSAAGKQQDSATPDMPFSQVLSSEMAHNRRNSSAAKEGTGTDAGADPASQAAPPSEAGMNSTATATANGAATATETVESTGDPLALPLAENAMIAPEALLALGISPDQLKLAPASPDLADTENPPALAANTLPFQNARKGRTPQTGQAEQIADKARGAQKAEPALAGKADVQAARTTEATATAFSGQLAAARQTEAMKTREFVSDLMSNPAMRPGTQAPLESLSTLNDIASPRLTPTVGTTAWNQALGEKIVWMTAGAQQSATLTLNPPNMGPLQIVLNVSNEQATASFFSAQPEVRQALEAALPKLREMMNDAGIQLGQATVSADTPQQNDASNRQAQRVVQAFPGAEGTVTAGLQSVQAPVQQSGRGLIDTFA
jgi:flagellar hook-length control protein FliK